MHAAAVVAGAAQVLPPLNTSYRFHAAYSAGTFIFAAGSTTSKASIPVQTMSFYYLKALHIIFVITWFAGLFYIVRLFIYFAEAAEKPEPERSILLKQYQLMQKRLWYGITWPSAILTLVFGLWVWHAWNWILPSWLVWKLSFVTGLYIYHYLCHRLFRQQQAGLVKYSSNQLRIWNEVATVFLFAIVFLVVLKTAMSMVWGVVGLLLFSAILMLAIRIYKRVRTRQENT